MYSDYLCSNVILLNWEQLMVRSWVSKGSSDISLLMSFGLNSG